ncbi:MAG: Nif11 family protein [Proteobacteria bacterium]|nr:Nif11 family protein [Pseudomonadota bacterium]
MSRQNLEQFIDQVADSSMLKARIGGVKNVDSLISLGAEYGCAFTMADLQDWAGLFDDKLSDEKTDELIRSGLSSNCSCKDPSRCTTDWMWCRQVVG